jgi:hypothetical protein
MRFTRVFVFLLRRRCRCCLLLFCIRLVSRWRVSSIFFVPGRRKVAADCLYNKELAEALALRCLGAWGRGAAVLVADSQVFYVCV